MTAPTGHAMVADACRYMEERYAERILVPELARRAGVSPSWFIRTFRRAMRVTPHAYLRRVRLVRAHQLLQRGVPLRQAAAMTGFATKSHLASVYRAVMGRSTGAVAKK